MYLDCVDCIWIARLYLDYTIRNWLYLDCVDCTIVFGLCRLYLDCMIVFGLYNYRIWLYLDCVDYTIVFGLYDFIWIWICLLKRYLIID